MGYSKKNRWKYNLSLGEAAAWPVAAAIRHFRDEFEWHITNPQEAQIRNFGLAHYADEIHVPVTV